LSVTDLRIFLDEDSLTRPVAEQLRRGGIDVTSVDETGRRGLTDAEQLAFASQDMRVLYTKNIGDFRQLHNLYM